MTNEIFSRAISELETDRQRKVEAVKQKVLAEQIAPYNRDIDTSLREALAELQSQYTAEIAAVQRKFEEQKTLLAERAAKSKSDYQETAIAAAVAGINAEIDEAVAYLKKFYEGK